MTEPQRRMPMRSSAALLAWGYAALGILALVLFAAPLWYTWEDIIDEGRAELLHEDAQRLATVFDHRGADGLVDFVNTRVSMQFAGERILLVTDAQRHPLAGNLAAWPADAPDDSDNFVASVDIGGHPTRAVFLRTRLPGGYNILIGRDVTKFVPLQNRFWYGLATAVTVLVIIGLLGGVMIRRVLLSRVHGIRQTVSAIMQGNLSHRLSPGRDGDELGTLSQTINGMLDQIEQLVHGVSNVSNAIAHDLRTPLAELRSRLEELVLTRPPAAQVFNEIEAAIADVDRVIRVFNALLRLAEIDTGLRRSGFVMVDPAEIAAEAVEFYRPAAELKEVSLAFRGHGPLRASGDPLLLAQAVNNLIDNALKYVDAHGRITVEVTGADQRIDIVVADNGPGIPDLEKPKVVERFYRGDVSRGTPGVGLGLSLVDAVAKLHRGALTFTDNHPGLQARLTLDQRSEEVAEQSPGPRLRGPNNGS